MSRLSKSIRLKAVALAILLAGLAAGIPAASAMAAEITVNKSPWCGCCKGWISHLRANGFDVTVNDYEDMSPVKSQLGVPERLQSCHTAVVDGYVIEGHVPADDIKRLLTEGPEAVGLAAPGMPAGSPGMDQGDRKEPYKVILFGKEGMSVYARH